MNHHAAGEGLFICSGETRQGGEMIDLGWLGQVAFTWEFFMAVLSIVLIDLVLAGDNAVVIAMAVKNLHGRERQMGIILGSGGAVVIRVICTFLVAQLLNMPFVKLVGGAVIIWIAVKLLTEGTKEECKEKECSSVWQALWIIIVADLSMGIDNMLAVGAASHGNLFLLLFGLLLSIPMVVFMSTWLSKLMDRYPIILWIGAAVLGKVGGEMMITDPWVHGLLNPPKWAEYGSMAFFIVAVCLLSKFLINNRRSKTAIEQPAVLQAAVVPADPNAAS
jgi:YjbE family integral membrane protein